MWAAIWQRAAATPSSAPRSWPPWRLAGRVPRSLRLAQAFSEAATPGGRFQMRGYLRDGRRQEDLQPEHRRGGSRDDAQRHRAKQEPVVSRACGWRP
jgi:hypothetical protein